MATSGVNNISTFTDYGAAQQDIERRRKLAEALQMQAYQPLESQGMAGGAPIPISPYAGLAKMLNAYVGATGQKRAGEESQALAGRRQQALSEALGGMPRAQTRDLNVVGMDDEGNAMPPALQTTQPTMQDNAAWLGKLGSIGPDAVAMGGTVLGMQQKADEADENRAFRKSESELTRLARKDQIEMQLRSEALSTERAAELRRELKQMDDTRARELQASQQSFMNNQNRQAAADRALTEAGRRQDRAATEAGRREDRAAAIEARRQDSLDRIRETARQKADTVEGKKDEAKQRVSVNLKALDDYYADLSKIGAAVDTTKSTGANASARIRATAAGQLLGGAVGSQEQTLRDNIKQMQPLLLQEIRQATAMGARGMDSNKELEFYLQAATDPKRSIQSNKAAMQVLENAYGLSSRIKGVDDSAVNSLKGEFRGATPAGGASGGWEIVR